MNAGHRTEPAPVQSFRFAGDANDRLTLVTRDVRTAIHSSVPDLNDTIGKKAAFEFGDCPHDAGTLTPEKEAGFRLSFRFGYPQGQTW